MKSFRSCIHNGRPARCAHDDLPVARIGTVQPHGVMMVLTHGVDAVEHVSSNVHEILGIPVADVLGRSPAAVFTDPASQQALAEILRPGRQFFDNPAVLHANGAKFEAICHVRDGKLIIEIEPYIEAERDYPTLVAEATEALSKQRSTDGLYKCAVDMMHFVTGYDRVKLYKFISHGHGQVVAEKHAPGSQLPNSFLNYFFAASDIPADALEILRTGKTRAKPQSSSPSVPLMTRAPDGSVVPSGASVDLTDAWLRGIHECDNGYNRNLGVGSNLIFPVNVDDEVWGLFVIHNLEEKLLNYDSRVIIEQMTMMFISKLMEIEAVEARIDERYKLGSTMIAAIENGRRIMDQLGDGRAETSWIHKKTLQTVSTQLAALTPRLFNDDGMAATDALDKFEQDLLNLLDAEGAAVIRAGRHSVVRLVGRTPDAMAVRGIASLIGDRLPALADSPYRVFATDALGDFAPLSDTVREVACGLVVAAIGDEPGNYILWFRPENVIDATWAGKPPAGDELLSPRMFRPKTSFMAHQAPLRGAARAWLEAEVRLASEFADAVTQIWRKNADRRRGIEHRRRAPEAAPGLMTGSAPYGEMPKPMYGTSRLMMDPAFAEGSRANGNGSMDYASEYESM